MHLTHDHSFLYITNECHSIETPVKCQPIDSLEKPCNNAKNCGKIKKLLINSLVIAVITIKNL